MIFVRGCCYVGGADIAKVGGAGAVDWGQMDLMQEVQEWQKYLGHMPEGQEQALVQQEVVQMT